MRVLLVNDLVPGPGSGAEVHVARLAHALVGEGHEVDVFAGEIAHRGAARLFDLWDPRARRALRDRVRTFGPDVVHYHNVLNELSPAVFTAKGGAASVLTVHDLRIAGGRSGPLPVSHPAELLRSGKDRLARELARRLVDVVVAPSEYVAARLRAAGFLRVQTVPGPPPAEAVVGPPGDDVLFAGRLSREKGVESLIEAFVEVAARYPATRLVVAGEGPDRARLEALAERRLRGRVAFPGLLDAAGVAAAIQNARLVCLPSVRPEAAPNVIVEAAMAARPLVAYDGPAPRELAGDGGVFVPLGDVQALAAAVDRLLADREAAAELGRRARARITAAGSADAVARRLGAVYSEAMARHG